MIHPTTELKYVNEEIGYGVVTTAFIPAGTITWALDKLDRQFSPSDVQSMEPVYQNIMDTYSYRNNKGNFVLCWDHGRYVNHSFRSNWLSTAYDFEIAIRDIEAGEQLTDDYGYLNMQHPFRGADEGTKRKVVYPEDLTKYYRVWDKKILKVFKKIITVDQPLRPLLTAELWDKIKNIVAGREQMDSILVNHFDRTEFNNAPEKQ